MLYSTFHHALERLDMQYPLTSEKGAGYILCPNPIIMSAPLLSVPVVRVYIARTNPLNRAHPNAKSHPFFGGLGCHT